MAHFQQLEFVRRAKQCFPDLFCGSNVLEIGSWDHNGSVRYFFDGCEYVGVDVAAGPGVDLVLQGQDVNFPTNHFDVVISCECFEHNQFWLETFVNMVRMLKPGGLCLVTCASTGRGEHGTRRSLSGASLSSSEVYPDYYRNLTDKDFSSRVDLCSHFSDFIFVRNKFSKDLYFVGVKKGGDGRNLCQLERDAREITVPGGASLGRLLIANAKWVMSNLFVGFLGERRYHNIKYAYKSTSRKIRGK